jgi:hypothetical protein
MMAIRVLAYEGYEQTAGKHIARIVDGGSERRLPIGLLLA